MSFTSITVTETYLPDKPSGTTPTGQVTFTLSGRIHDGSGNEANPEPIVAQLSTGAISQVLYANDDAATVPPGSYYTVQEVIDGITRPPFQITVPHTAGSGTCTLASLS